MHHCAKFKSRLGFGDFDRIFKVRGGLRFQIFVPGYLLNQVMKFHQICLDISLGEGKELIRFWYTGPISK